MKAEFMEVTPQIAERLLTYNTNNRKVKHKAINEYAYKMKNGLWNNNTLDPIIITKDGVLENGQHRLLAVIQANKAIRMFVITEAESASGTYDMNVPRTMSDTLAIRGKCAPVFSSTCSQGVMSLLFDYLKLPRKTPELVEKYIDAYGDILEQALTATRSGKKNPISRKSSCVLAAYTALRNHVKYEIIQRFFNVVNTGFSDGVEESSAIIMRNYLLTLGKVRATSISPYPVRKEIYIMAEMALRDYSNGIPRKRAYVLDQDKLVWLPNVLKEDEAYMKGETI